MALTYSITGGADGAKFNINASTGALTFKTAPDFEKPGDADTNNIYQVEVGVSDGTATTKQMINVTVTNVADENLPPQFTSPAAFTVPENQTTVATLTATDPDAGGGGTPPPLTGWPDASNTGCKGTLTNSNAGNSSSNGQRFENLNLGVLTVTHANVVVKNCKAQSILLWDGPGCTVEDCTVTGSGVAQQTGIDLSSAGGKVLRCNISGVENGIAIGGIDGGTVKDCYIHDNASPGNPDPHYDGIAMQGGQRNILIEHNYVTGSGLSAVVFIKSDWGAIDGITVNNNKLIGGGYTCYSDEKSGGITNEKYTNNVLGGWVYGPLLSNNPVEWSGNVNESGAPVAAGAVSKIAADKEIPSRKQRTKKKA